MRALGTRLGKTKMASSLDELAKYFDEKTAKMKTCLELRGIDSSEDAVATLRSINIEVTEMEEIMCEFKEYLSNQKALLQKSEALSEVVKVFHQRTEHIASNLPQHLPGRKSAESARILREKDQESAVAQPAKKKSKLKSAGSVPFHKIDYLTTEEFQDVPKYLKGRLTYPQINSAIDQINKVLAAKYKILRTSRAGMSEHVMRNYVEFKEQETTETKGCCFFIDKDLKEYSSFKLDKSGRSMLNIFRHCGKLKEVRGGKLWDNDNSAHARPVDV